MPGGKKLFIAEGSIFSKSAPFVEPRSNWLKYNNASTVKPMKVKAPIFIFWGSIQFYKKYKADFKDINLSMINDAFGGWTKAQKTHFADGGIFDQIYAKQ